MDSIGGHLPQVQVTHRSYSTGTARIIGERIDANASVLNSDERVVLTAVADLQGETPDHTYTRYGLTKWVTDYWGEAFKGGVMVHNTSDYLRALESSARMHGGRDTYGVTAEEYGRLVDTYA